MGRSLPVENLLPQNVESIIDYFAVIYWSSPIGTLSCSWLQLATGNGVRDGSSNWLVAPHPHEQYSKLVQIQPGIDPATVSMRGNHLAYAPLRVIYIYIYIYIYYTLLIYRSCCSLYKNQDYKKGKHCSHNCGRCLSEGNTCNELLNNSRRQIRSIPVT